MEEKAIKVIHFFGSLNIGGAECRMMDVFREIDKSIVNFDFVTMTSGKQFFEDEIKSLGGNIIKINSPREIGIRKHIFEIRELLRNGNYSAVHAHTSYHCGIVMLAARLEHIPVRISHARTTGSKSKSKSKPLSIILGRILINRFATKKLAVSRAAGEFVFGNNRFEILPNAIEIRKYQNVSKIEIEKIKRDFGILESDFVIGQIGRFNLMKNHSFSLRWFSDFLREKPNSKMVFVGNGSLKSEIQELAVKLGISDQIVFTGTRNDIGKIIHIFDVLLLPSVFEGLGGVALEAQAAGVPVVESDSVPIETDMGLGLVQRVSLQAEMYVWTDAILRSKDISRPSYEIINQKFSEKNYTLSSSVARLTKIYEGAK